MNDDRARYRELRAKEKKLKFLSTLGSAGLGLSAQGFIDPPSIVPFLRDPGIAYLVLGLSAVGCIVATVLILPLFKEMAALSPRDR